MPCWLARQWHHQRKILRNVTSLVSLSLAISMAPLALHEIWHASRILTFVVWHTVEAGEDKTAVDESAAGTFRVMESYGKSDLTLATQPFRPGFGHSVDIKTGAQAGTAYNQHPTCITNKNGNKRDWLISLPREACGCKFRQSCMLYAVRAASPSPFQLCLPLSSPPYIQL